MVIMNMTGGGKSGPKIPLNSISTLSATAGDTEATIKWTDVGDLTVNGVLANEWISTKLVRKVGSAPSTSSDGTLVVTETVADTYSSTGYTDTGLTNGTTYYYGAFSVGGNGLESGSNSASVTPSGGGWQPGADTIAYYKLEEDLNDYSGNNRNISMGSGTFSYSTLTSGKKYCVVNTSAYITPLSMPFDKNAYTMSVWFNIDAKSSNGAILTEVVVGSNYRPRFSITGNNDISGIVSLESTGVSWVSGQWYYVVTTYENGAGKCYINGALVGTGTFSGSGTSGNFYINPSNSGFRCGGGITELIIENKTRSTQEIKDYYNQTCEDYGLQPIN